MNIASYLLANTYSGFSPVLNTASAICTVNGQQTPCGPVFAVFGAVMPFVLLVLVIMFIAGWKVFTKAGQPGWAVIVPIYNIVVMLQIVRKPLWWIILYFIPIANVIIGLIVAYNLAKVFGKGTGFTLGLIFLPFIFYPILAFGKSTYLQITQTV